MRKLLSCLVIGVLLMSAMPYVVAAMNETGTEDYIKILDKERRLTVAESTSTAHLKNNLLDLHFTEQNSDLWQFQWQPGQWGESCYHEHFGVYTDNAGRTLESEEFTIDQPFTDPGGVPGTITAILHYGDIQVKRKITLISGDIRFFEIGYTIKNIGSSTLNDVRFFQTIDFDIPWTSDCTDDYASYDAEHDYVVVSDGEYFNNSFKALRHSDRHGIDHWSTEIYEDWDDGNLNNANSYGPGDPGIGMQYNLGNLAPGAEEIVTITVWSGEPAEEMKPKFDSITFGDNEGNHYTEDYPPEYNNDHCNVLRRGQSFDLNVDIENFDDDNHKIIFKITKPNGETQMFTAKKDGFLGSGWDPCTYERIWDWHDPLNPNKFKFEIHIPGDDQVGKYQLIGMIQKKDGDITYDTYGDDEDAPEFYVIFNPWSSEDDDVFYPQEHELDFFVLDDGYEYTRRKYIVSGELGYPEKWTLEPCSKIVFDYAIQRVAGKTSASTVSFEIVDLVSCNAGHNGFDGWELVHDDNGGYELGSDDLIQDNSFNPSEMLAGAWFNTYDVFVEENDYLSAYEFRDWPFRGSPTNARDIIKLWEQSLEIDDKNPVGQCPHFGALGASLTRSVGIPSKMITTLDGKMAHKPNNWPSWNYHVWAEVWIKSEGEREWKPIATTYQVGPKSRCDALYQTEIESFNCYGNDADGFADGVLTDKVVPHWILWWKLGKDDILDKYKECQASTLQLAKAEFDDQLEINVTTDKSQYDLEEDITINTTITNNKDSQVTENLTTVMTGMAAGGLMDYEFEDVREITVPSHSTITETYTLPQEDHVRSRDYLVVSYIGEVGDSTEFYVVGGINLTVTLPETVLIDESFDVRLVVENIADVPIDNIEISAGIGSDATVSGAPINVIIPTLAPGATNITTWLVSMPNDGYQSMVFSAQSERGDYEQIFAGTEVMSNPFLRVAVEVPSSVQKDTTFTVLATIVNAGDLAAEDVQSTLYLPPELTTSDNLIRYIGTIDPHANTTIEWNIVANEGGTSAFTIVTNSSTTSGEDVIFIPIFIYDHDLEVSVEQPQIEADGELHIINMTIHNFGNVEDSVLLQYLVTNRNISFSIYDGDERIISQPVTVPANGDKTLNLKIIPEYEATGAITIHATSELDPTASDSINIEVISPSPNQPPINPTLAPDKPEPQPAGTTITWTASATDPDGDTLYYRFWIKGPSTGDSWTIMQDWSTANTRTWHTSSADIGDTDISVWIRDGHHAPISSFDLEKIVYDYRIVSETCKVQITSHSSLQDRPSIVYANGYYYVAYQSWETSYPGLEHGRDIFIKKFDSNWNELAKVQVTSNRHYQDSPSLAFANNKLYVAYVSNEEGANANDYDVILKEYDLNLNYIGGSKRYLTTLPSCQDMPSLLYKDGYFYLAYQSWETGSSYHGDIYIKKFDSNWNQVKKVRVTSETSYQDRPSLIYANSYFYVAYFSMETGNYDIFVKRLDANLNSDSWKKQITSESSSQSYPSLKFVNNEYAIAYASNEGGTLGIFMKKYDSNWNFIEKTEVIDDNSANERRPAMTYAQNNYWIAYVHNLVGSDDWNIFAIIPGCEDGPSPTPTPTPTPKLLWEITVDKAEYSPGDYVHLTQRFTNEGEDPVLITNPITTTFIAEDGSIVLEEDLSYSISVTLGAGGQWSFGTSYKLPDDAPEGYYDVRVSISGGNYVKTVEDLFYVKAGGVPGDVTGDGRVDYKDLEEIFDHWMGGGIYDVDRSGLVGYSDVKFILDHWTASKPYGSATTTVKGPVTVPLGSSFKVLIKTDGTVEAAHTNVIFPSELKIESINADPYDNFDFATYQNGTNWVDIIVANDVAYVAPSIAPVLAEIGFTATQEGTYTIHLSSVINGEVNDVEALTVEVEVEAESIDTTPPVVISVEQSNDFPEQGEDVTITAHVTDNIGVTSVTLGYDTIEVAMTLDSGSEKDGYWNAAIPGQPACTTLTIYITLSDAAGNTATFGPHEKHWVDTIAPAISNVKVSPTYALPGDSINISAKVFDSSGVKWVRAYINKDGELAGTVFLSDPDEDEVYTGTWQTMNFTESGIYNIDISATDTEGNETLAKGPEVEIA